MTISWQDALILGLVAAAMIFVVRRVWRVGSGKHRPGCGSCPKCAERCGHQRPISIDPRQKS
jgi:hypothetical protein